MSNEQNFLVKYGLQHFVSHAQMEAHSVFVIHARENQKMVRHAASLIDGTYGAATTIQYD